MNKKSNLIRQLVITQLLIVMNKALPVMLINAVLERPLQLKPRLEE